MTSYEELEQNRNPKRKTGFHCKKHRLNMFSLDYCPICATERIYGRKEKNELTDSEV